MISLHNRKCVTDRKLNSLLMRTAFCRGGMYSGLLFQTRGPGSQSNYKMAALQHGSRKFYEIPSEELTHFRHSYKLKKGRNIEELLTYIDQSCIGKDVSFSGPYGLRKGKQSIATHILKNTPASGLYIFFCSLLNDT